MAKEIIKSWLYDKDGNKSGVTKVDLDVVEDLKQFKI